MHVELQSQEESGFAERIFIYNYRIFDRYRRPVISLVVLGDERPNWRPRTYSYKLAGFCHYIRFPIVKLLDDEDQWDILEQSRNPFAVMVMAHLKIKATTSDLDARSRWKWQLVRGLYERGYDKKDILQLFRLVDWMMALPDDLQLQFEERIDRYQKEKKMPLLSHIELRAQKRGALQNASESVLEVLKFRFGQLSPAIEKDLSAIEDLAALKQFHWQALAVSSLVEFQQQLAAVLDAKDNGN